VSIYRFIAAERVTFGVKMLCRHLSVSTSAFYDWQRRPPSRREVEDRALTRRIREVRWHRDSPDPITAALDDRSRQRDIRHSHPRAANSRAVA
jgi:hypothetical protein